HPYSPGALSVEGRIPDETIQALIDLGHKVEVWPDWSPRAGSLCTIVVGSDRAPLVAGADPRRLAYAIGW
ncbi:MAG TPA: hypothetical protein VFQ54_00940, partial [Thermomicrobiales bacterium]|nr:hypothetical protein [Thermomicrobiales bacterium]